MSIDERIYRVLLLAYPRSFRDEYAEEMIRLFLEQVRDERTAGHRGAMALLWIRTVSDISATAPQEYAKRRKRVPEPVSGGFAAAPSSSRERWARPRVALALLPVWSWLFLSLVAPAFLEPSSRIPRRSPVCRRASSDWHSCFFGP